MTKARPDMQHLSIRYAFFASSAFCKASDQYTIPGVLGCCLLSTIGQAPFSPHHSVPADPVPLYSSPYFLFPVGVYCTSLPYSSVPFSCAALGFCSLDSKARIVNELSLLREPDRNSNEVDCNQ